MQHYIRYWDEDGRNNKDIVESLFRPDYAQAVQAEMHYLFRAYGIGPRFGRAHPAPCSAWRSERTLDSHEAQREARFANRIHVFEDRWPENFGGSATIMTAEEESLDPRLRGMDTRRRTPFLVPDATQRYLGYVSLRPKGHLPFNPNVKEYLRYTSVAVLTPPPFMVRPRYHLITCMAGPADGVLPFRAVPYCSPDSIPGDSQRNKAPCMHAALHASLLLKCNSYRCRPISSQDMIALLWELDHTDRIPLLLDENGKDETGHQTYSRWSEKGLSLEQSLSILGHPEVNAGGILEEFTDPGTSQSGNRVEAIAMRALRCLLDYIGNGVPVIMEVRLNEGGANGSRSNKHAIMVFGYHLLADPDDDRWPLPDDDSIEMRRVDYRELPTRFVFHDGFYGPYHVRSAGHILRKAWSNADVDSNRLAALNANGQGSIAPGIRFVAVLPHGARIGIEDVRKFALDQLRDRKFPAAYLREQLSYPEELVKKIVAMPPHERNPQKKSLLSQVADVIEKWRDEFALEPDKLPCDQELFNRLAAPGASAAMRQAQQELSWMHEFKEATESQVGPVGDDAPEGIIPDAAVLPRLVTRLLQSHQILGRYLVDETDMKMGPGHCDGAFDVVNRALMDYQQWYNFCLRPVDSPSPLFWWVVEVRSPYQPLVTRAIDQTANGDSEKSKAYGRSRSRPAHVFCWPIIVPTSRYKRAPTDSGSDAAMTVPLAGLATSVAVDDTATIMRPTPPPGVRVEPVISITYLQDRKAQVHTYYYEINELFPNDYILENRNGKSAEEAGDDSLVAEMEKYFRERRDELVKIVANQRVKAVAAGEPDRNWQEAVYEWGGRDA